MPPQAQIVAVVPRRVACSRGQWLLGGLLPLEANVASNTTSRSQTWITQQFIVCVVTPDFLPLISLVPQDLKVIVQSTFTMKRKLANDPAGERKKQQYATLKETESIYNQSKQYPLAQARSMSMDCHSKGSIEHSDWRPPPHAKHGKLKVL